MTIVGTRQNRDAALAAIAEMRALTDRTRPGRVVIAGLLDRVNEVQIRRNIARAADAERIDMVIDSPGGLVGVADRIERDLRQVGCPVVATVGSVCGSAAIGVLLAARRRVGQWQSRFHLHPTCFERADIPWPTVDAGTLRRLADDLDGDDRRYRTQLATISLPAHLLARANTRDGLDLSAYEAVAYRLLDRVEPRLIGGRPV
jgi:ATP-dependent protease ClpP protease subunit